MSYTMLFNKHGKSHPGWPQPFQVSLTAGLADESVICPLGFSFQPVSPINLFFSLEDLP